MIIIIDLHHYLSEKGNTKP